MEEDAALVGAALSGGPEAFGPIIERYQDAVFGVALTRVRDFSDAEDIAQDVFIEAFEHLGSLENPSRLGAWLRSITIHRCIDHLRQRREVMDVEEIAEQVVDPSTPHTELERVELRDQVMAAIGRLSKTQRETTTLFYVDGYSQAEIARIQEVPIGTVWRRLHDAREKLKEEMLDMVEEVLKAEAPREDFGKRIFDMLSRYHRPTPWGRWREIISDIQRTGKDGMDGFIQALESPHSQTRVFAAMLMGNASNEDVVVELYKKALGDSNKKVRRHALGWLLDMDVSEERKRREFVPLVLPLLGDRSSVVRRGAALALYEWGTRHPQWVGDISLEVVAQALIQEKTPKAYNTIKHLLQFVLDARASDKG